LAVVLVSEFMAVCINPKAPVLAGLGWVVGASALAIGTDAASTEVAAFAVVLFAIGRGSP
jgi:hypothetical protein